MVGAGANEEEEDPWAERWVGELEGEGEEEEGGQGRANDAVDASIISRGW